MKYTDQQILDAVWRASIKMMKHGMLDHYFGGRHALPDRKGYEQSQGWGMRYACSIATPMMKPWLNLELSQGQLKKRINELCQSGRLKALQKPIGGSYTFMLPDEYLTEAYAFARQFMSDRGLTSEPQVITDIDQIKDDMQAAVFAKFGEVLPEAK